VVQYGNSKDYAIVGDEVEAQVAASRMQHSGGAAPSGAPHHYNGSFQPRAPGGGEGPAGPRGRGRDAVQPAWMTQGMQQTAAAPGNTAELPAPPTQVSSVAEALAIIEKLGGGKHKKAKKKKGSKHKEKKMKDKKMHKKTKQKGKQRDEEDSSDSVA